MHRTRMFDLLGIRSTYFLKNTRAEELPSTNRGIVVPPLHCFEFDYKFTLFRSAYIANAESFKVSSVDQELDPVLKIKFACAKNIENGTRHKKCKAKPE